MTLPSPVTIVEVGPRDGLQNEAAAIATADKITFVDRLSDAGHRIIEVSAFVSPKWVPQMADAAEVFAGITRRPGTRYTALVPNLAGLSRAIDARVDDAGAAGGERVDHVAKAWLVLAVVLEQVAEERASITVEGCRSG